MGPPLRKRALLALLSLAACWAGAEARVLSISFVPPTYVSGDRVEAYVTWDDAGIAWYPISQDSGFPAPADGGPVLRSARLETRGGKPVLVAVFTPWRPGESSLPPISLGGVSFPPIALDTASALAGSEGFVPRPWPQLEPEGLRARVYAMSALALALCLLGLAAFLKARPWLRRLADQWAQARARKDLEAILDFLGKSPDGSASDSWAVLCSALRRFLGARSGTDFSALTPREVADLPPDSVPDGGASDAAVILGAGDEARFAGQSDLGLPEALALTRSLADRVENACRKPPARTGRAGGKGA